MNCVSDGGCGMEPDGKKSCQMSALCEWIHVGFHPVVATFDVALTP